MTLDRQVLTRGTSRVDRERQALMALASAVQAAGVFVDRAALVNLYVGIKSKPLTLLVGPEQSGKIAALRCLAQVLTGSDCLRAQFMPGHAWWAGQSGNVGLYTNAQSRLNTCKLLALLEEAHEPENRERVLMGCLTRISPAELLTFFSATAFQLQHGELMRLCAAHFTEPVPYPRNLLLAGTFDAAGAHDLESELLAKTTVIHWPACDISAGESAPVQGVLGDFGREFLASMVRTEAEARLKLCRVLKQSLEAVGPLACLEALLQAHAQELAAPLVGEVLVYLANTFSRTGQGLFDRRPSVNLEMALDWALTTVVVPRLGGPWPPARQLRASLQSFVAQRWPNTTRALEAVPTRA